MQRSARDIGAFEASDDLSDPVSQDANSAKIDADFLVRAIVGACQGEAAVASGFVELAEDAAYRPVGRSAEIYSIAGEEPEGATDCSIENRFRDRVDRHGVS